ncbi:MAG: hypothetical protein A3F10_02455 [Coxiella sp. RIFCSPHIGHO2_12_FULL_42_15]|nr:MAG: hypothetical protein A3F10_02455 [Coxiella sp. RIFCSPHIGHO2_12_FULL_42_15]
MLPLTLCLEDLLSTDKNGFLLVEWMRKTNNQPLLNRIYDLIENKFDNDFNDQRELSNPYSYTEIRDTTKRNKAAAIAGWSIFHWAIFCHQSMDVINSMLKEFDVNVRSNVNLTPLHLAARTGQFEMVEFLISKNADINARASSGATALLYATEKNYKNVVNMLLKYGADIFLCLRETSEYHIRFKAREGDSPLHIAIRLGYKDIVKDFLRNRNIDVNAEVEGTTPLRIAAEMGHAEIVELLIESGVDINRRSPCGATALLLAVEKNHKRVVNVLIRHGADISLSLQANSEYHDNFKVKAGDTPLQAAINLGYGDIAQIIIQYSLEQRDGEWQDSRALNMQ